MQQYMDAAAVNELRIMRAELAVFNNRDYREPILVKSPAQQMSDDIDADQKRRIRDGINAQLYAKLNKE